jgi:hypothetical protein
MARYRFPPPPPLTHTHTHHTRACTHTTTHAPGLDYTVAHYGIITSAPRLDAVLAFADDSPEAADAWSVGEVRELLSVAQGRAACACLAHCVGANVAVRFTARLQPDTCAHQHSPPPAHPTTPPHRWAALRRTCWLTRTRKRRALRQCTARTATTPA